MKLFWIVILWISETFTGLIRNMWGNATAVLLTVACLTLFSVSYVVGLNATYFSKTLDNKIEIRVDIKDDVTTYKKYEKKILNLKGVSDIQFVSKETAYKKMEKEMADNAEVLHAVGENPFQAQFIVRVDNPSQIDGIVTQIKALHIHEDVQYGKEYVEKLISFTKTIQRIGYAVTVLAGIFTIYIVTNVIKYNIDKRQDELKIKHLTGAGMLTIRLPFILEALVITLFAGVCVYELFVWGYGKVEEIIRDMITYAPLLPKEGVLNDLFFPLLIISLGIGLLGSFISTQRFIAKY